LYHSPEKRQQASWHRVDFSAGCAAGQKSGIGLKSPSEAEIASFGARIYPIPIVGLADRLRPDLAQNLPPNSNG
jgi:hypothetical protein